MSENKEYIERGAALGKCTRVFRGSTMLVATREDINAIPAADVEPVVRGELRINEQGLLECSVCGHTLRMPLVSTHEMKRCYICGAYLERSGDA